MNQDRPASQSLSAAGKVLIALLLALAAYLLYFAIDSTWGIGNARDTQIINTEKGVDYDYASGSLFYSYDTRFYYFCTKDGMKYISSNGDERWQSTYTLSKPIMATHSSFVAVGEDKGRRVYVFNPEGLYYSKEFKNPVLTFSVNQTGYLAVVLQLDKGYSIQLFNKNYINDPLYEYYIPDPTITPTAVCVSADGKYVVIALLDYGTRLSSQVLFCYVNEQDAWGTVDGGFASAKYDNQITHTVRFMGNDRVLVFTDTQILCYRPGSDAFPNPEWDISLHNKIYPIDFYGDSRFAYATGDKLLNDYDAAEPGEVNIYDLNGERTGVFRLGRKATYLSMGHNHVIVGGDRSFYVLNHQGRRIWDYQTIQDTRAFIFLENTNTVLAAGNAKATVMKRVKIKVQNETAENEIIY